MQIDCSRYTGCVSKLTSRFLRSSPVVWSYKCLIRCPTPKPFGCRKGCVKKTKHPLWLDFTKLFPKVDKIQSSELWRETSCDFKSLAEMLKVKIKIKIYLKDRKLSATSTCFFLYSWVFIQFYAIFTQCGFPFRSTLNTNRK